MKLILLSVLLAGAVIPGEAPAVEAFQTRLDEYVKIRSQAGRAVPAPGKQAQPEDIERHQRALAAAIRKARPHAKAGDILGSDIRPLFVRLLGGSMTGAKGSNARASIREGNPTHEKVAGETVPLIEVNAKYPRNAPLSTVPPTLLLKLPKLPKDIEYRFVGRTLILHDRQSSLIIDYMKEAVPAL